MKPLRLLLVDDEVVFLKTLANRLKKRGIPAMTAECGRRCLEILDDHPMDVVILDVKMPELNGLDVLKEIKRHHPDTEIIFLTGHGSTSDGVAGIKAGAFDYLTKPVDLDHLLNKIGQAHEKKSRSEEKKREDTRRAAMKKQLLASERLAALGVLASGVAHEINNPLAIIQGWSELLKALLQDIDMDFPQREEFENGFEKIELAVNRAKQITHKMLGTVQKQTEQMISIQPADLLRKSVALVREAASNKQLFIVQSPETSPAKFRVAPYPVQQVLLNILNNAIDATPARGTITCRTSTEDNIFIVFEIEDSGPGIPPEIAEKIFDPFFTTKPTGEGVGLGLYISRKIVEKQGGTITAKSTPGRGTVFTIRLPVQ